MKHTTKISADPARLPPREALQDIILTLRRALPRPATDDPAAAARRDRAAMAAVVALLPVNAAEGRLAAQFVAADAWAADCLRQAEERRREPEVAREFAAQATAMLREAKSSLRLLLRLQAQRQKVAADGAAAGAAAWTEHALARWLWEALEPELATPATPPAVAGDRTRRQAVAGGETHSQESANETPAGFGLPPPRRG